MASGAAGGATGPHMRALGQTPPPSNRAAGHGGIWGAHRFGASFVLTQLTTATHVSRTASHCDIRGSVLHDTWTLASREKSTCPAHLNDNVMKAKENREALTLSLKENVVMGATCEICLFQVLPRNLVSSAQKTWVVFV